MCQEEGKMPILKRLECKRKELESEKEKIIKEIEAIDMVSALLEKDELASPTDLVAITIGDNAPLHRSTGIIEAVRRFLEGNPGKEFTSTDVAKGLVNMGVSDSNSLAATAYGALKRLFKRGVIEMKKNEKKTWVFSYNEKSDDSKGGGEL